MWPSLYPVDVVGGGSDKLQNDMKFPSFLTALRQRSQHAVGQAAMIIC